MRACKVTAVVVVFVLVLFAAPLSALAAGTSATVSGAVRCPDGDTVAGAEVTVNVYSKGAYRPIAVRTTDDAGLWTYTGREGSYRFDFSASSADPASRILTLEKRGSYTLDIVLPAYGAVTGVLTSAVDGTPLEGASVEFYLRNPDGSWPASSTASTGTAADGSYSSGDLPVGTYAVKGAAAGYVPAFYAGAALELAAPVVVVRGGTANATFGLSPQPPAGTGTISGTVVSGAGRTPVAGAYVYLYKRNADGTWPPTSPGWGSPYRTVLTAASGSYASGSLPLGDYLVRFFDVHLGSQWWPYAPSPDLATPVAIAVDGQAVTGIEGWFGKP